MNDFLTKEIELCGIDMPQNDFEAVSEIIYDALMQKGIYCDSFSWSINVEYTPQDELDD
jgi:hypothetical protein|tara:strand:+ start:301 stop:477 length:177 start_codon:yes stop_codon:yes gene_type:complete